MKYKTLGTLVLAGALAFGGCGSDTKPESNGEVTVRLGVTDYARLNNPGYGIKYTGMISDSIFSVSEGVQWAVNFYYPVSAKKIDYYKNTYNVIKVTPDSLVLSYIDN